MWFENDISSAFCVNVPSIPWLKITIFNFVAFKWYPMSLDLAIVVEVRYAEPAQLRLRTQAPIFPCHRSPVHREVRHVWRGEYHQQKSCTVLKNQDNRMRVNSHLPKGALSSALSSSLLHAKNFFSQHLGYCISLSILVTSVLWYSKTPARELLIYMNSKHQQKWYWNLLSEEYHICSKKWQWINEDQR